MSETSGSGAPVLRHQSVEGETLKAPAHLPEAWEEALNDHRERYLGPAPLVLHEIVSDTIHLDVWPHEARLGRGVTIVTQGASALPRETPDGTSVRVELLTYVSESFVDEQGQVVSDERVWWPGRMLKDVARFPHDYDTWIGSGHSLSFSDPPAPIVEGSQLTSVILLAPPEEEAFEFAEVPGGEVVRYLWAMPITTAELALKNASGVGALCDAFDAARIPLVCNADRACAVSGRPAKRGLFRRR